VSQQGLRDMFKSLSPEWLQEGVAEKLLYSMGAAMDTLVEKINQGMRLHMPGYGDPTGLSYIGQDRLIPQGYQETSAAYASRLKLAWDSWLHAGSVVAILNQILGYVSPATPIVQFVSNTSVWDTINTALGGWSHYAAPANWNWDYWTTAWWRSWMIMQSTPWSSEGTYGDGQTYGDGGAWGTTATPAQCQSLQAIVKLWKPAHNAVVIIISYDTTLFDNTLAFGSAQLPDGHHGLSYKSVAGVMTPTRFSTCAYLEGGT
jgi:hypothetical protein